MSFDIAAFIKGVAHPVIKNSSPRMKHKCIFKTVLLDMYILTS